MTQKRRVKISFIASFLLLFYGCLATKYSIQKTNFPFEIKEVFYQKNIAGEQTASNYYELSIELFNLQQEINIDSVYFKGTKSFVNKWQKKDRIILSVKTPLKVVNENNVFLQTELKSNQAVLIGSKLGKKQYFLVDSIIQKADIYLP